MKVVLIILFSLGLSFFTKTVKAQQDIIRMDSLKKVLMAESTDSVNLKKYLVLAVSKLQSNNTEAKILILDWLITVSKEKKYKQIEANGYYWKGAAYFVAGVEDKAVEWYTKALEFSRNIGYAYIENNANIGLGGFYFNNQQYEKARLYFEKAIEISKKNNFGSSLASAYMNMANVVYGSTAHDSNPAYDEVIRYMKLCAEVAEKRKDTTFLIKAYVGIGSMYNLKKDYPASESHLLKAAAYLTVNRWEHLGPNFYGNLGEINKVQNKHHEAIPHFKKGLAILKKYPDPNFEYKIYQSLSESYEAIGDYENAYKSKNIYAAIRDSLLTKENYKANAELENKYQQVFKDKEISRLNADQRIKQLELEKQKAIISGKILEAETKEAEIKLLFQEKELQNLQLKQQEEVLGKSNLQTKADAQQIVLNKQEALLQEKQIQNQQRIRNYLLGGLGLLAILSFILVRNITARKKAYKQLEDKSQQVKEQALQLSKQTRQIAQFQSQMNPHFVYNALHNIQGLVLTDDKQKANTQIQSLALLMRKTFANAEKDDIPVEEEINYLRKYVEFEKGAFEHNLNFDVVVSKDAEGTLIPPMMIQPLIENSIKHAELRNKEHPYIKVLIDIENNLLSIQVKDNGAGIKKNIQETDKLSHSMSVLKSRLDLIFKGNANIRNEPVLSVKSFPEIAEGTNIKFYLPLNYSY